MQYIYIYTGNKPRSLRMMFSKRIFFFITLGGSMYGILTYTFAIEIKHSCTYIYQSHGPRPTHWLGIPPWKGKGISSEMPETSPTFTKFSIYLICTSKTLIESACSTGRWSNEWLMFLKMDWLKPTTTHFLGHFFLFWWNSPSSRPLQVSRLAVNWALLMDNIGGFVARRLNTKNSPGLHFLRETVGSLNDAIVWLTIYYEMVLLHYRWSLLLLTTFRWSFGKKLW